eukprot:CAMPEP_0204433262 /NCGR_PEP_ID=MMETSP0470-20130426/69157_1 /ASSEMBLY_ACC=CAM_ASM_000385 /TAXON_ID=2969 /ORGANISM="Oxyrrhis marina" /LENGTH=47 /DNA_ID= /DNA_START= /DNA_END= /DNA_ORIENTATION=
MFITRIPTLVMSTLQAGTARCAMTLAGNKHSHMGSNQQCCGGEGPAW